MTDKQQHIYDALVELGDKHPTVRSLADHLETRKHRTERWTDNEVSGLLHRLKNEGLVGAYEGEHGVRWYATPKAADE